MRLLLMAWLGRAARRLGSDSVRVRARRRPARARVDLRVGPAARGGVRRRPPPEAGERVAHSPPSPPPSPPPASASSRSRWSTARFANARERRLAGTLVVEHEPAGARRRASVKTRYFTAHPPRPRPCAQLPRGSAAGGSSRAWGSSGRARRRSSSSSEGRRRRRSSRRGIRRIPGRGRARRRRNRGARHGGACVLYTHASPVRRPDGRPGA